MEIDDQDERVVTLILGMTLADIVEQMDDFDQDTFSLTIEFLDTVLTIQLKLTQGRLQ